MKFKVGDRVAVYGPERDVGTISEVNGRGFVRMDPDDNNFDTNWFHPKQCRRLVKKERRRVWVVFAEHISQRDMLIADPLHIWEPGERQRAVEFIEVKKK